jgi:hypothetical protein
LLLFRDLSRSSARSRQKKCQKTLMSGKIGIYGYYQQRSNHC